jgi:hypothetical protein
MMNNLTWLPVLDYKIALKFDFMTILALLNYMQYSHVLFFFFASFQEIQAHPNLE